MTAEAPAKARSDIEILVEKFNQWAEERIFYYEDMPAEYVERHRAVQRARIETLQFAKANLEKLAKELIKAD